MFVNVWYWTTWHNSRLNRSCSRLHTRFARGDTRALDYPAIHLQAVSSLSCNSCTPYVLRASPVRSLPPSLSDSVCGTWPWWHMTMMACLDGACTHDAICACSAPMLDSLQRGRCASMHGLWTQGKERAAPGEAATHVSTCVAWPPRRWQSAALRAHVPPCATSLHAVFSA